jgi:hypothetical protein
VPKAGTASCWSRNFTDHSLGSVSAGPTKPPRTSSVVLASKWQRPGRSWQRKTLATTRRIGSSAFSAGSACNRQTRSWSALPVFTKCHTFAPHVVLQPRGLFWRPEIRLLSAWADFDPASTFAASKHSGYCHFAPPVCLLFGTPFTLIAVLTRARGRAAAITGIELLDLREPAVWCFGAGQRRRFRFSEIVGRDSRRRWSLGGPTLLMVASPTGSSTSTPANSTAGT